MTLLHHPCYIERLESDIVCVSPDVWSKQNNISKVTNLLLMSVELLEVLANRNNFESTARASYNPPLLLLLSNVPNEVLLMMRTARKPTALLIRFFGFILVLLSV
jgi:hypothetical protein